MTLLMIGAKRDISVQVAAFAIVERLLLPAFKRIFARGRQTLFYGRCL